MDGGRLCRRDVLRLAGLAGAAAVLDACTGGGGTAKHTATQSASSPRSGAATTTPGSVGAARSQGSHARSAFAELKGQLGDRLALPGESRYQPAMLLYNPRFAHQAKPQAIAYCAHRHDVVDCVRFAAGGGAPLRIRNGGHSYGGWSSGPGLVADVAGIKGVHVDHSAMTATIGAGALLADVYAALAAKGVSIGGGSCATVGVTGLTLGGGVGLLTRLYGLTCDQLESAVVVTADSTARTVSKHEHPDLFWALRGGGGSFGAVTSLTFNVRPAPQVREIFLQWPGSDARQVLAAWQDWTRHVPREMWSTCKVLVQPGKGMRTLVAAYWTGSGSPDTHIRGLLRQTPTPSGNYPSSNPYGVAMLAAAGCHGTANACIAAALTPAQRLPEAAASSILHDPLPDKAIHAIVSAVETGMDVKHLVEGGVSFDALGGAVSDLGPHDTAFRWRTAIADIQYTATWPFDRAAHPARYDSFVRAERAALLPYVGQDGYVNYADPSLQDYASAYWGANLARLQQVKKTYDPHDVFSFPQAVPT